MALGTRSDFKAAAAASRAVKHPVPLGKRGMLCIPAGSIPPWAHTSHSTTGCRGAALTL